MANYARCVELWNENRKYGISISFIHLRQLLNICINADSIETGGIIVGYYQKNYSCAAITDITDAPSDSERSNNIFIRGIKGLQKIVDKIWRRDKTYYLGEWHYHTGSCCESSYQDIKRMKAISISDDYCCPEPISIIIGIQKRSIYKMCCYVFPRSKEVVILRSHIPHIELQIDDSAFRGTAKVVLMTKSG